MGDHTRSVDEKIDALIHSLLDRAEQSSPRDTHSLACAIKELYGCQDQARANKESDWMAKLSEANSDLDLTPDFSNPENPDN